VPFATRSSLIIYGLGWLKQLKIELWISGIRPGFKSEGKYPGLFVFAGLGADWTQLRYYLVVTHITDLEDR